MSGESDPYTTDMPRLRDLLSSSFSFCRRHGRAVLLIVLVVYIPIDLVLEAIPFDDDRFLQSFGRYYRKARILEMLVGVFCTMAIAHLVLADREGRSLSVKDAFWHAAARWRASVGTQIILNLLLAASILALVLPVFFYWVATVFVIPLVALRELSGTAAIKASWALVRGRWWAMFRLLLLLMVVRVAFITVALLPYFFLPEHYAIEVLFAVVADVVSALFTVATVQLMLTLESDRAQAEIYPAAAMYPAV